MRRRSQRLIVTLVLAVSPLLVAASDPTGDVAACPDAPRGVAGDVPDLIRARGQIVELGTSATWTLRFADDLVVPDEEGKPFRVDLVLLDPSAPRVRFAYYRGLNRVIRYDAVLDPELRILLLPERGQNVFLPPTIEGDTMTFQVPGRILSADEDQTGTSPGIAEVRWSVIVRDEGSCDLLGDGRPTEPMIVGPSVTDRVHEDLGTATGGTSSVWIWIVAVGAIAIGAIGYVVRRRTAGRGAA